MGKHRCKPQAPAICNQQTKGKYAEQTLTIALRCPGMPSPAFGKSKANGKVKWSNPPPRPQKTSEDIIGSKGGRQHNFCGFSWKHFPRMYLSDMQVKRHVIVILTCHQSTWPLLEQSKAFLYSCTIAGDWATYSRRCINPPLPF